MSGSAVLSERTRGRGVALAALALFVALGVAGCGVAASVSQSSAVRSADRHATIAGEVMVRDNWERPANDAAYLVVGTGSDDTINAVDVEGTTYHGRIVLRITVEPDAESGDGPVTRCYAYTFRHQLHDAKPARVDCTDRVVTLTAPAPEPAFDSAAAARLTAILRRLVAQHSTQPATIQQQVEAAFGPPVTVRVGPAGLDHGTNHGTMIVNLGVPSHDECMWSVLTVDGHVTTKVGNRRDCAD